MEPFTRVEMFLAKAAGQDVTTPKPITRVEKFLQNLIDHIASIGNGGGSGGVSVQPDLSQNDPEAADYVKGIIRQESLPEGYPYKKESLTTAEKQITITIATDGGMGYAQTSWLKYDGFIEGKLYRVVLNGVTYDTSAYVSGANNNIVVLGNASIMNSSFKTENDFPFIMYCGGSSIYMYHSTAGTYTINLYNLEKEIKCADESYIPTTVPRTPTAFVGQTIVVKAVDENGKPTEWEAVDLPSSSEPIIVSSEDYDNDQITCNLTYEEVYDRLSGSIFYFAACRLNTVDKILYLDCWSDNTDLATPCIMLKFKDLGGTLEDVNIHYKSDGTLTQFNPNGK